MITLLSPAKSLDLEKDKYTDIQTTHAFPAETMQLVRILKKYKVNDLRALMDISENLAKENVKRYKSFKKDYDEAITAAAIYAFRGDVYVGLDADTFRKNEIKYAQKHIRILSGLYGILRPMDRIQAYRLEMSTSLENKKGKNLYAFWDDKITKYLNRELKESGSDTVINLASKEYFKAIRPEKLKANIINVDFREDRNGRLTFISFNAKKARGMMARFIIQNKIKSVDDLIGFDTDGYQYVEGQDKSKLLFVK